MGFEFKGKKENKIVAWFKGLSQKKKAAVIAAAVLILIVLIAGAFVLSKLSKLDTEQIGANDIIVNEMEEEVGVGFTNIVLFGADSRKNDVTKDLNTDSIIIVSLNNATKEVKLVSVYRDTLMDMTDGNIQKCNSAYRRGGAAQAISMLNMNMDMNIQKYITVSWGIVVDVVDMIGGVELDVSEAEVNAINKYLKSTARVAGKEVHKLTQPGVQTLDGVQAATYARVRKGVGDDFARTGRQRKLIQAVLDKAMNADLDTINKIIDAVFPGISTNLTVAEILKYASNLIKYEITETAGFPFLKDNATLGGRGSCAFSQDLVSDVKTLHEFLFGETEYEPSEKVHSIADEVAYIVGSGNNNSDNQSNNDYNQYENDDDDDDKTVTTTTSAVTESTTEQEVTTEASSTEAPSTEAPSTEVPSIEAPSTEVPSTEAPSTEVPSTEAPSTEAPSTEAPSTEAPSTEAPSTEAPASEVSTTSQNAESDAAQTNVEEESSDN